MSVLSVWRHAARVAAALSAALCLWLLLGMAAAPLAGAQPYPDMAAVPDPASFIKRTDTGLTLLGDPIRFGGADVPWLGLRQDGAAPARRPTAYEVTDVLQTLLALGGTVIRSVTLAGTAGCSLCLEPSEGHFSPEAFANLDRVLKVAGDMGMHVILPLTGGSADCAADAHPQSGTGTTPCAYLGWHNAGGNAAFFTDPAIRAAFLGHVHALVSHVNALTGVAYRDDPTILAWENCAGCGAGADPAAVGDWTEAVGQVIKATDRFHLYENGAFAGHLRPGRPGAVPAADFAPPSVDLVGDTGLPPGDEATIDATMDALTGVVNKSGRVYVLDGIDIGPRLLKTEAELEAYFAALFRERAIAGVLVQGLEGHADTGGYLPASPAGEAGTAIFFPGRKTADMQQADMVARDRALRRFEFEMQDILDPPAHLLPPVPDIISAAHGRVVWRGAAGAGLYTIERSPDPSVPNSFSVVCDHCTSDEAGFWQDPSPPKGRAWYRIMPFNMNGHKSLPSAPVASQ